ncbi:hypothetical protein FSARC_13194 [Fusarium sarcochroum]|uniref:Major facilitator superfamily (MFS) profile domain-containing protein n=1 Tax=Fusarium sarcochroum TaxID=1208366 RepID=A0A8H4T390_9HYPO|nr:hypothetical protein FSARC_13194 [Fusarium sarcochroum]
MSTPKQPESPTAPAQNTAPQNEHMFETNEKNDYTSSNAPVSDDDSHKEIGVGRVEAFNKVLYQSGRKGKILLWLLGISIFLTMFAYALDMGITTTIFGTLAASTFKVHSQLGTVNTASQIIRAISKPFIGKLSDITSRPTTYVVVLVFYVVGFIVAAAAGDFASYTVGICFTSVGKSGLDLLSDIIVADLTPLEWRGFFSACLSLPFVITVPINGFIAEGFYDNWRWGLGMFTILIPVLLAPAILTLYTMQRRGEKAGMVTMADSKDVRKGVSEATPKNLTYWAKLAYRGLIDIDIIGLILLGFAFSLILLPITLAKSAKGGWHNASMIAMIVMGFVILILFALFEMFLAPKPLMTKRILKNRAFIAGVIIHVFNQMASSVRNTYFSSYILIIKEWTTYQWTIFLGITTMGLSLVGPCVGLLHRRSHRYKSLAVFGAAAKILGYGLLIQPSGDMTQDTARLVAAQLIFCLSSFNVVGARVGVQASVPHDDIAALISIITLWSTLGSSVGSAIATSIWTEQMVDEMWEQIPTNNGTLITGIYGSITTLKQYPMDDPIRQGGIRAYSIVNGHITVCSIALACVTLIATLFMPNFYLGKQQNAVNNKGLDGEVVDVPTDKHGVNNADVAEPRTIWQKAAAFYRK